MLPWPKSSPVVVGKFERPTTSKERKKTVKISNKVVYQPPEDETSRSSVTLKTPAGTPQPEEQSPVYREDNINLYLATFYSNIGSFLFGIAMGWSNGALESVKDRSSYGFTPSALQWNYVIILLTLGAMFWCLPAGFLLQWFGCKRTILVQMLPNTLGWCLTLWGYNIKMLYAGRFILGMCGGAHCVAVPIYSAEISTIRTRGILGVCFYGACIVGVIYSLLMNYFLEINKVNLINLLLHMFCLLQFLMPESPAYYVKRQRIERAENSLRWLRGKNSNVMKEMARLMKEPTQSEHDQLQNPRHGFKYGKVRKSLARVLALALLHKLSGAYVFILFSCELMECLILPRELLVAIAVPSLVGFLACMYFVERRGRKHLLIVCSATMFFSALFIGIGFKLLVESGGDILPWLTFICMPFFVGSYTAGLGTLSWLLTVELIVPPMRPLCCSIAATVNWLCASFVIFWYSSLKLACQPYLFLAFAIVAAIAVVFTVVYIPETKGVPYKHIQYQMGKKKTIPITPADSSDESDAEVTL